MYRLPNIVLIQFANGINIDLDIVIDELFLMPVWLLHNNVYRRLKDTRSVTATKFLQTVFIIKIVQQTCVLPITSRKNIKSG